MTQGDVIISAGVVCKDKLKFSLVCYTKEQLTEAQINLINFFLNKNLKNNDFEKEWNKFNVKIVQINPNNSIHCYIFETAGGSKNAAQETATIVFLHSTT